MKENRINIAEILKECPEGTKLYSTVFGEVEFSEVSDNNVYIERLGRIFQLTSDGRMYFCSEGECTLFPSKDQRDWSKFVPPYKFKDGDIVATKSGTQVFILKREKSDGIGYCYIGWDFIDNEFFPEGERLFSKLATEEEKQKFFDAIKLNGYKWNAETKTLEKLVKPKFKVGDKIVNNFRKYIGASGTQGVISEITDDKYIFTDSSYISISNQDSWELVSDRFDPKTLKAFDKVLARMKYGMWYADFVSLPIDALNTTLCVMGDKDFDTIIPYNDETKHLLCTTDDAPEFYKYWED